MALNAMSWVADTAREEASDPRKKIRRPERRTSFLDQISDSFPYNSWKEVDVLLDI
jgi:hypothetical protein